MIVSVVYFITGLLGFLTLTVVVAQYKWNRKINFYLLVLFFFTSCRFFFNGVYALMPFAVDERLGILFRSFGCAIFPCVYLYFKNLILDKKNVSLDELPHFIVPVSFGFANLLVREYAPFLHFYFYFLFLAIAVYYLVLTYIELKNKVGFKPAVDVADKQKMFIRNWSVFFFVVCVLSTVRLTVTLLLDIYISGFSNGSSCLWISALLSCLAFFKVLLTPFVMYNFTQIEDKVKKQQNYQLVFEDFWILPDKVSVVSFEKLHLKAEEGESLIGYVQKVEKMALKHCCFRDQFFAIGDFADILGVSKESLVYFFDYHANVSFVDFKKIVRIYDSINLINKDYLEFNSVDQLSEKVGFSSSGLFLSSFKEVAGVFPEEYSFIDSEEYYEVR